MTFTRRTNTRRRRRTRSTIPLDQQELILPTPEQQEDNTPNPLTDSTEATKEADNPQLERNFQIEKLTQALSRGASIDFERPCYWVQSL